MATDYMIEREYRVPTDEDETCPYCGRPFWSKRYMAFHVGIDHAEECSDVELEVFDEERDEEYELITFHFKAAISVFLSHFLFTFIYALVWPG